MIHMRIIGEALASVLALVLLAACGFLLAAYCCGCSAAANLQREQARAAVVATAEALNVADETCGRVARALEDVELARECTNAYRAGRTALIATGEGVDAWERSSEHGSLICAVVDAAQWLDRMRVAIALRSAPVPPILDDARRLVGVLGGCPDAS